MATTQYIGSRYVPIFADPVEWSSTKEYEPLTIVLHEGNSFTSKQYVPIGIDITNDMFWAETGNYNAQVEQYRRETQQAVAQINDWYDAAVTEYAEKYSAKSFAFDTVADMQNSINLLYIGAICHTNGFYESGDGGAAWYIINNSDTANGINVLDCNNNLVASLVISKVANPIMFGARGNGITYDTENIQAMLDSGVEYIDGLNKTYKLDDINQEIETGLNGLFIKNSVHITNLKTKCNPNISIFFTPFNVISGDLVVFENVEIDGTSNATYTGSQDGGVSGIKTSLNYNGKIIITNCYFHDCYTDALQIRPGVELIVKNSKIEKCGRNGATCNCEKIYFDNCDFVECGNRTNPKSAFHVEPDGNLAISSIVITNCRFINTYLTDIKLDIPSDYTLSVNSIFISNVFCVKDNPVNAQSFALSLRTGFVIKSIIIADSEMYGISARLSDAANPELQYVESVLVHNVNSKEYSSTLHFTAKRVIVENCKLSRSIYISTGNEEIICRNCHWNGYGVTAVASITPIYNNIETCNITFESCEFTAIPAPLIHTNCKSLRIINCIHWDKSSNIVGPITADFIQVINSVFSAVGTAPTINLGAANETPCLISNSIFYRTAFYTGANVSESNNKSLT